MRALNRVFRAKTINTQRRGVAFSIRQLFANSEPGVWYDPSDFSTLFQDSAGTMPVTAVEQPVGLMLDKSKGPVLGPELVTNGDFSNGTTGWIIDNRGDGAVSVYNGTLTLSSTKNYQTDRAAVYQVLNLSAGTYEISGDVIAKDVSFFWYIIGTIFGASNIGGVAYSPGVGSFRRFITVPTSGNIWFEFRVSGTLTIDNISVRELPGNHAYQTTTTSRPVLSARVNRYLSTETLATQNVTTLAAQYRLSFEGTGTITLSGTATGVYSAGSHLITCTAGTLTSTVSGSVTKADLRVANDGANLPPYQRVNTATDYDTQGFPHYLRFDGVDDWLVTNTITPGIDKAQVFAGVRKLSDAVSWTQVCELSANGDTNNGTLQLVAPGNVSTSIDYAFYSRGSVLAYTGNPGVFLAPITNVLTALGDISAPSAMLRINGTQVAQNITSQGTGNYLAYPLYIGMRGGTKYPFNGHLYSLIVRFGPNLPIATIEKTEKYINGLTKAY